MKHWPLSLSMDKLPIEILHEIFMFLNPKSQQKLNNVCRKFKRTKVHFKNKLPADVVQKSNVTVFQQEGQDLLFVRVNGIDKPTSTYPLGRRRGVRTFGDRCVVSEVPLAYQQRTWGKTVEGQAVYFEVKVLETTNPLQSMRIGVVHQDWDQTRPPGSLNGSIGFCSTDGSISTGSVYDERFTFGPHWGVGDVVGCGYTPYYDNGLLFFTLNGRWVGDAPYKTEQRLINYRKMWLAAFSSNCPAQVEFNYGAQPFLYGIDENHSAPFLKKRFTEPCLDNLRFQIETQTLVVLPIVDGFRIQFPLGSFDPISAQANLPITKFPKTRNIHYFEIKILGNPGGSSPFLSLGLATTPYPQRHHVGWNKNSIGLHRYLKLK